MIINKNTIIYDVIFKSRIQYCVIDTPTRETFYRLYRECVLYEMIHQP